jgi:hypothetical protein
MLDFFSESALEKALEAIGQFPFHTSQPPPKYPTIAAVLRRMNEHKIRTGHNPPFSG